MSLLLISVLYLAVSNYGVAPSVGVYGGDLGMKRMIFERSNKHQGVDMKVINNMKQSIEKESQGSFRRLSHIFINLAIQGVLVGIYFWLKPEKWLIYTVLILWILVLFQLGYEIFKGCKHKFNNYKNKVYWR